MKVPDVWITIGKRGFSNEDLERLCNYQIKGFRINTGRSTLSWTRQAISILINMGISPAQIFLDIGNKKPRVLLKKDERLDLHFFDIISISKEVNALTDGWLRNDLFFTQISMNDIVYFGDGEIECSVVKIDNDYVELVALSEGVLTNNVAIGIVGKNFSYFSVTLDEINDINSILVDYPVSLILSFVEERDNITWTKSKFPNASDIIPKIETAAAVRNFASIVGMVNTVFVGRGDLGLALGIEKIGVIQKQLISVAHKSGCNIVIGTGILDSLRWNQVPLRAEVVDITNFCYESVDAIVLTSETAGAKKPYKAIDFLFKTLLYISQVE